MIFLTVGTVMPFDRLVKSIDNLVCEGVIQEEVFGQIGRSAYRPRNFQHAEILSSEVFENYLGKADKIVGHAGIGTIVMSLKHRKPLLIMPRMKEYSEHVNDHQVGTAAKFEAGGHVLVAYTQDQLPDRLSILDCFEPVLRKPFIDGVVCRLTSFMNSVM